MLICPECGYKNEMDSIFCHQCGVKLDLGKIKPADGIRIVRRKGRWTAQRVVVRIAWILILAFLVWGIYSICQTPDVQLVRPTNAELLAADNKRLGLEQMILQKKRYVGGFSMQVTASEINAYINNVGLEKRTSGGFAVVPISLRVDLGDGTVTLNLLGEARLGSSLSRKVLLSFTGVPTTERGSFEFSPVAAAIGQLPIPQSVLRSTGFLQGYFGRVLDKLDHEKSLLGQLTSIKVNPGRVLLRYQSKSDAAKPAAH